MSEPDAFVEGIAKRYFELHEAILAEQHGNKPLPWNLENESVRERFRKLAKTMIQDPDLKVRLSPRVLHFSEVGKDWTMQITQGDAKREDPWRLEILVGDSLGHRTFFASHEEARDFLRAMKRAYGVFATKLNVPRNKRVK